MRDTEAIEKAMEMMENRIERDDFPLLLAIWHAKRDALDRTLSDGAEEVEEVLNGALFEDLSVIQYVQIQGGINAVAWAREEMDSL